MPRYSSLPPVGTLVIFEAVARHQSFTRAGEELGVTQGAVSQSIKLLEKKLGVLLFLRLPRRTVLTAEGERFAQAVRDGLDGIANTARALRSRRKSPILTVTVLSSFAFKWLFPRLLRFEEANPGIELRFNTTDELVDLVTGDSDAAIRYGSGRYPGLHVERVLGEETMVPVCSPALLRRGPPLRRPSDLGRHVLLHDEIPRIDGWRPGWHTWLAAAGVKSVDLDGGRRFGLAAATIQAAIEGMGVALGRSSLVLDDLAARRLVSPFGPPVKSGFNYYLVCPRERITEPKLARFREWLVAQARDQAPPASANG
jgi:LysR family glycine cleavage system transcriptional activator